jgi:ABC-type transporter Mla subunit MlaD
MMLDRRAVAALGLLMFAGCGDRSLHLKVHYRDASGLSAGAPVVKGAAAIGSVESIAADPKGGYLVGIEIGDGHAAAATAASRFYLADQPQGQGKKQIEIEQADPGGPVLAEGTTVEGSERLSGLMPFGELFRQFGDGLKGLRGQLEQFQDDLRKVPDSPEAKQLREEWRRLAEEMQRAQAQAEESVKSDLLPKLQQEMDRLREQFKEFRPQPAPGKKEPPPI